MTEIIQSNLKYNTLRQTAMNNTKQSNPNLPDSFLLICKVPLVTPHVKLQMSNYWRAVADHQRLFNFLLLI